MAAPSAKPRFFARPADFRRWLEKNHAQERELIVGFWKKGTGRPSITWEQSVEEALCFGWIDGVRRTLDADSYTIRFTPRRTGSIWSAKNLKTMQTLIDSRRIQPAGLAIYEARDPAKATLYSFEREGTTFSPEQERTFRARKKAWAFFEAQAPSYRRVATHWVVSAKKPETQARRLVQLIADSAAGRRIAALSRPPRKK